MTTRVLIAEDNPDHAFFTARGFRAPGVEIETVSDGAAALDFLHRRGEYADRSRPHLIVLDLKMPKVDGLGVLREIKESAELRTIPTVVLSSSDRREDIESTYRLGGNAYSVKGATLDGLRDGVRALAEYWSELTRLPSPPE
ncbi:MAG TPA: response regulator [Mycobacteriales bacterium]|nr:response regulator [Mycobacteriales bacterium]